MTQTPSILLDVREKDEFEAEHVPGAIHVALSNFKAEVPRVLSQVQLSPDREVLILCRSGKRAQLAMAELTAMGYANRVRLKVFEGGILEWKRQGMPVNVQKRGHFPVMRQVQLVMGLGVMGSVALALLVDPLYSLIAAFFGAGAFVAGATGYCGMADLLAVLPWNKTSGLTEAKGCDLNR